MIRLWEAREPIHPKRLEEKIGMAGLSRTHDQKIYCKMRSKPVKYSRKMSCTVRHCEDLSSLLSPSFFSFLHGICRNMASFGENMAVLSSLSTKYTEILCSYSPILDVYERFCLYVEVRKCPENRKDRVRILAVLN